MDVRIGIKVILDKKRSSGIFLFAGVEAWDQHGQTLLSAGMNHDDWVELAAVFRHLLEIVAPLKEKFSELPDGAREPLENAQEACEEGEKILEPFIVEGRVPFFRPESVFNP
jgi:hypothetical protein